MAALGIAHFADCVRNDGCFSGARGKASGLIVFYLMARSAYALRVTADDNGFLGCGKMAALEILASRSLLGMTGCFLRRGEAGTML
jgi:hypothetical protein